MKKSLSLLFIILIAYSCNKDFETDSLNQLSVKVEELKIDNGRFSFSTKEQLTSEIKKLKNSSIEDVQRSFEKVYDLGFMSLRPMVDKKNSRILEKISNRRDKLSKKNGPDLSRLIGDKFFASFINDEGEIIVDNKLYIFTPKGLFFGGLQDSGEVRRVAIENNNLSLRNSHASICELRSQYGGITRVTEKVDRFIAPSRNLGLCGDGDESSGGGDNSGGSGSTEEGDNPGGSSSSGGGNSSGGSSSSHSLGEQAKKSDIALNSIIQSLRTVTNPDDNWFQNIFGEYKYAHEYFSNRDYRFEIDYWNQKWLIYRSLGVEAETHEEGWLWWNNVKSDELILGINNVHLTYEYPAPQINYGLNYVQNNLNQFTTQPLYMHNGNYMIRNIGSGTNFQNVQVKVVNNSRIPFFKFRDKTTLNIYLGKVFGNNVSVSYNVFNDSNIKLLYKLGADFLKQVGSTRKDFFITIQRNQNEIDVLYFDEYKRMYNTDELERKFDSDWAFIVGAKSTDTGNTWSSDYGLQNLNPTGSPAFDFLGEYKYKSIDVYGLARRGNEWRGLRLDYN